MGRWSPKFVWNRTKCTGLVCTSTSRPYYFEGCAYVVDVHPWLKLNCYWVSYTVFNPITNVISCVYLLFEIWNWISVSSIAILLFNPMQLAVSNYHYLKIITTFANYLHHSWAMIWSWRFCNLYYHKWILEGYASCIKEETLDLILILKWRGPASTSWTEIGIAQSSLFR